MTLTLPSGTSLLGLLACLVGSHLAPSSAQAAEPVSNLGTVAVRSRTFAARRLAMVSLRVSARVEGAMARTEMTQVFANPYDTPLEGIYQLRLPDGVSPSRFAMDVDGAMVEGRLVERGAARSAYTTIVSEQQDPALLEWVQGNLFRARVFPIPARGTKTVVLAYEEILPETDQGLSYRYVLPRLSGEQAIPVGTFDFELTARAAGRLSLHSSPDGALVRVRSGRLSLQRRKQLPRGPLKVLIRRGARGNGEPRTAPAGPDGTRQYFLAELRPELDTAAASTGRQVIVCLDTSASVPRSTLKQASLAASLLLGGFPADTRKTLVHGGWQARTCDGGGDAWAVCLKGLEPGDGTDLAALLRAGGKMARSRRGAASVVLFSDGVPSLGELEPDRLSADLRAAFAGLDLVVHTVATGGPEGQRTLARLADALGGHALRMSDATPPDELAGRLARAIRTPAPWDVEVQTLEGSVAGLVPVRPRHGAGSSLALVGRLDSPRARIRLRARFGDASLERVFSVEGRKGSSSELLGRLWAHANMQAMLSRGAPAAEVTAFSLAHGVMSPYTSFLVLEREADYRRHRIERRDPQKTREPASSSPPAAPLARGMSWPAAKGGGINRVRYPFEFAVDRSGKGEVKLGRASITGRLPREVVERTVGQHIELYRACYDEARERSRRRLAGRLLLAWIITSSGRTDRLRVVENPTGDQGLGDCLTDVLRGRASTLARLLEREPERLSGFQVANLLTLYRKLGRLAAARRLFERRYPSLRAAGIRQALDVFWNAWARERFPKHLAEVANAALTAQVGVERAADYLLRAALRTGDLKQAVARLGTLRLETWAAEGLLRRLVEGKHTQAAHELIRAWEPAYTPSQLVSVLSSEQLRQAFPGVVYRATSRLLDAGKGDLAVIRRHVEAALLAVPREEALGILRKTCRQQPVALGWCRDRLGDAAVDALDPEVDALRHARVRNARSLLQGSPGDPALLGELATTLRTLGDQAGARRFASEIVEHAPRSPAAHQAHGKLLEALRPANVAAACRSYANVLRLSRQGWWALHDLTELLGRHPSQASELRECIVSAVSRRPPERPGYVLLTWDEPDVRADVSVVPIDGSAPNLPVTRVWRGRLALYVLSWTPSGPFRVSISANSHRARTLRGRATVVVAPGSIGERRTDVDVLIPPGRLGREVPLLRFPP